MSSVGHLQPQHHFRGVIPIFFWAMLACGGMETLVWGHPGHSHSAVKEHQPDEDQDGDEEAIMLGQPLEAEDFPRLLAMLDPKESRSNQNNAPEMARAFEAFVKSRVIQTRWNERFFFVESRGIPDHRMMVGITAWQQQVPLPQPYAGENAWQIPLHPVPAKKPLSANNRFLRGAIAIAANGVPIFNPLNNRGDDAFLIGELDEFGGHCGRADDYHYHIAPVHLEKTVGKGLPIAYALDGYPIYGYEEPDGSKVKGLDSFNGHQDANGNYHYHATKTYPYLNGGFHGEVTERGGQVDPQPRAEPVRPDGRPLRDAKITDFVESQPGSYVLTYELRGKKGTVSYAVAADGGTKFTFVDPEGCTKSETYPAKRRGGGRNDRRDPPPRPDAPPPRRDDRGSEGAPPQATATKRRTDLPELQVTSAAIDAQGRLSAEYTCDGASASPPVEWTGAPLGTKSFAVSLWHTAVDQEKSYWVIYDIPADVTKMGRNSKNVGTVGLNDKRRATYDPMCSKGPGVKTYHLTVYALSGPPKLTADQATRANLLTAIKSLTIAEGTLDFTYERKK